MISFIKFSNLSSSLNLHFITLKKIDSLKEKLLHIPYFIYILFMNEMMQFWMSNSITSKQTIQQLKLIYDTTMIFNFHTSICLTSSGATKFSHYNLQCHLLPSIYIYTHNKNDREELNEWTKGWELLTIESKVGT